MPNTDLIPDIRSKGVKYHIFFEKPKAKIVPSTAIVFDGWRTWFQGIEFFTFNEKKLKPIPRFFEMSKWSLGGFQQSRLTSVIQGGRGGRGGVGGREGHPLLIDHISSGMFPTPRKRIREHIWRKFSTKLKIKYKEMGLALYRDLYRLLTIRISKGRFNVTSPPLMRSHK